MLPPKYFEFGLVFDLIKTTQNPKTQLFKASDDCLFVRESFLAFEHFTKNQPKESRSRFRVKNTLC